MVICSSLLFLTSLLRMAASTTYYVIPDDYPLHNYTSSNTFTLQHYLNNTSEYFVSHNQLHFFPGQYHKNADSFTVKNIAFIDCQKLLMSPNEKFYVSLLFYDCNYVNMQNLYVNVRYNVSNAPKELTGISLINVFYSMISNVKVQVSTLMCHTHPISLSGLAIRYNVRAKVQSSGVIIKAFNYYPQKSCLNYSQCAFKCMMITTFFVSIQNTAFANLSNCSTLHYYGGVNNYNRRFTYLSIKNVIVMDITVGRINFEDKNFEDFEDFEDTY